MAKASEYRSVNNHCLLQADLMKLVYVRLSVRSLLIPVAILALLAAGARRLIVGDGGVAVELYNDLDRPLSDIRIVSNGNSIAARKLAPGQLVAGRLWPADTRRDGSMNALFHVSFTFAGRVYQVTPHLTFDRLNREQRKTVRGPWTRFTSMIGWNKVGHTRFAAQN